MSYKLPVNEDNLNTVQELLRVQSMRDEARKSDDTVMMRLHQIDLESLWAKLELTPCFVCYHGNHTPCNQQCRWLTRCVSSLNAGLIVEQEGCKALEVSLNFEIQ